MPEHFVASKSYGPDRVRTVDSVLTAGIVQLN